MSSDIRYDRRVDPDFLELFLDGGALSELREIAHRAALPLDLQMRKYPKDGRQWATLYAGLTKVLDVTRHGNSVRLSAHRTYTEDRRFGFDKTWAKGIELKTLDRHWTEIELYLERVIPYAVRKHAMTEGVVQDVASKATAASWAVLDREVTPSFRDTLHRQQVLHECMKPLVGLAAAHRVPGLPKGPAKFGNECDLLALDDQGRLLAIEVKPLSGSIAWVSAQAAMYARLLQHWADHDDTTPGQGGSPSQVIAGTLAQRQALGHSLGFAATVPDALQVVPVVVLQRGSTEKRRAQMLQVRELLAAQLPDLPPVEIYEVSILGRFTSLTN